MEEGRCARGHEIAASFGIKVSETDPFWKDRTFLELNYAVRKQPYKKSTELRGGLYFSTQRVRCCRILILSFPTVFRSGKCACRRGLSQIQFVIMYQRFSLLHTGIVL